MANIISLILSGSSMMRDYAHKLVKDVEVKKFARKPELGGTIINCVHPAFVLGHLCRYPSMVLPSVGIDGSSVKTPESYENLFKNGAACEDDVEGKIYPHKDELMSYYFNAYDFAIENLKSLADEKLMSANLDEKSKARWPYTGDRLGFIMTTHIAMHLGQISTWRRCMGMGVA